MPDIKKILSYFFDLSIEKRQSQFSGEVEVSLRKGQYMLSTSKAIYSFGKKYTSFERAFKAIDVEHLKTENVLVLGFGLGSVVDLLEKKSSIKNITAVDSDAVIIELAKKYLQSGLRDKVIYVCKDAGQFVLDELIKYDLVLFDVFIEDLTPVQFMQPEFLTALRKLVAPSGMLLFSKINDSRSSKIENTQFETKFSATFPDSFSIDADGNRIFAWFNTSNHSE